MKKTILVLFGLLAIAAVTISLFYKGFLRTNYPSVDKYPVRGIDVSHHQKDIDWQQLKNQNIQFVFIKATEGGDFKDKKFKENWDKAISARIDVGAYHFFTFCKSGREQAKNFIETVPKLNSALPPVVDLEFGGNCSLKMDHKSVIKEIDTLLQLVEQHYKKEPVLYVTKEFYDKFLVNQFSNNPIWIRDIYNEPVLIDNRNWLFWQYANRGHLKGIDTYVDLNVFFGTKEEYKQLKNRPNNKYHEF